MTQFLPISDQRLEAIREATKSDSVMQSLKETIMQGWPDHKQEVSKKVALYFHFRDEMAVVDGIILRGDRVVIPSELRRVMLSKIHSSHLGINGCLRHARESLYWPIMSSDIKEYIAKCNVCNETLSANPPETLIGHEIPDRLWSRIGTDLFTINAKDYLVTVDYFSGFFELDCLSTTTSRAVINKLKDHFGVHGSPEKVVSDNGPQFSSEEFAE